MVEFIKLKQFNKNKLYSYYRLMRLHQPTGIWLVLWPSLWGILLASPEILPLKLIILFSIGAVFARASGCIINDIVDKDIDKFVERTKTRPIASGEISVKEGITLLFLLLLICLGILVQLPNLSIIIGFLSLVPITIYPFMKRVTFWPQLFLGFTFNLSSLVGVAAVLNEINFGGFLLYSSCIFWTLGYDTIYGHQDKKDDLIIGMKSTSIFLADKTKAWLYLFYGMFICLLLVAGCYFKLNYIFCFALIPAIVHLIWQISSLDINDPRDCQRKFYSNRYVGWFIAFGILLNKILLLGS